MTLRPRRANVILLRRPWWKRCLRWPKLFVQNYGIVRRSPQVSRWEALSVAFDLSLIVLRKGGTHVDKAKNGQARRT